MSSLRPPAGGRYTQGIVENKIHEISLHIRRVELFVHKTYMFIPAYPTPLMLLMDFMQLHMAWCGVLLTITLIIGKKGKLEPGEGKTRFL
jgi:hypothetical protein